MIVRTSYFGGLSSYDSADEDAVFGVVRYPRDFVERLTGRNIPAVVPSEDLLNAYKTVEKAADENDEANPAVVAWNTVSYEPRYLASLKRTGPQTVLDELTTALASNAKRSPRHRAPGPPASTSRPRFRSRQKVR